MPWFYLTFNKDDYNQIPSRELRITAIDLEADVQT
jgi:hypothetical protein